MVVCIQLGVSSPRGKQREKEVEKVRETDTEKETLR